MKSSISSLFQTPSRLGLAIGGAGLVLGSVLVGLQAANRSLPRLVVPVGNAVIGLSVGAGLVSAVSSAIARSSEQPEYRDRAYPEPSTHDMEGREPEIPYPQGWQGHGRGTLVSLESGSSVWVQEVIPTEVPQPIYTVPIDYETQSSAPVQSFSEEPQAEPLRQSVNPVEDYADVGSNPWGDDEPELPPQPGNDRFAELPNFAKSPDFPDSLPLLDLHYDYSQPGQPGGRQ